MLNFHALGPFQAVDRDSVLDLGGQRQRAVLARLVVAHGRAVPMSVLVDELWPGEPPARALSTIQGYVSRLRRALEPDRAPREEAEILISAPPGYALRTGPDSVDTWLFETLVRADQSEPAAMVWERLERALSLWRGPALAEFADLPWAAAEALRLDELRLMAIEHRAEAALRLGRAAAAVPDLEAHTSAHPLREEAWRLLALALYRAGRQGDALGALRRARTLLREELGLDLGITLQRLERDILTQATHLDSPVLGIPATGTRTGEPAALRVVIADDQALVRTGLRFVLENETGFDLVGEAGDGEQAIALVRRTRPDLVLMDISMPRLDGLAAARRILTDADPPKMIMMTAFGTDDNLYAALRAGVSGFVLKTSAPEQIIAAMRAAAAGDALIDPAVTTRLIACFAGHSAPTVPPGLKGLSDSDLDLVKLVARGLTNQQVAATLAVPAESVSDTVAALLDRLGLFDRAQLVVLAYESGLISPGA